MQNEKEILNSFQDMTANGGWQMQSYMPFINALDLWSKNINLLQPLQYF